MLTKSPIPRDQSILSQPFPIVHAYKKPRPKESVKSYFFPECRCLRKASSQGISQVIFLSQVSMLTKSLVPRDQSSHTVFLSQVSMLTKSLVPRDQWSQICFPSVDAYEKPRPKGSVKSYLFPECRCLRKASSQGISQVIQYFFPKCRCLRKASSQGTSQVIFLSRVSMLTKSLVPRDQSSVSFPSASVCEKYSPKVISQVSLSQVSVLMKSLVLRGSVKFVCLKSSYSAKEESC